MRYRFIREHARRWPVNAQCRVLGVSRSGYYAWRDRPMSSRARANVWAVAHIRRVYSVSGGAYGSVRVQRQLSKEGQSINHKRVERLMRQHGLASVARRRRHRVTTDSNHAHPFAPNLLQRDFARVRQPNTVWLSDVTYIRTAEGWLYLVTVMDLASRRIVGWTTGSRLDVALVTTAVQQALARRRPPRQLVFHSDRGLQYAHPAFRAMLESNGLTASMSRKGDCWDNAPQESFFASLKCERVHRRGYLTRTEAKNDLYDYIERFYNRQRLHSGIGYLTPEEYEKRWQAD